MIPENLTPSMIGAEAFSAPLRPVEIIKDELLQNVDNKWRESVYRTMVRVFGVDEELYGNTIKTFAGITLFPLLRPIVRPIGKTSLISMILSDTAKTRVSNIMPVFTGENVDFLNKLKSEIFAARMRGQSVQRGWAEDIDAAYIDSWFGAGFLKFSVTPTDRVIVQHSPLLQTFWDTNSVSIDDSRWIACIEYETKESIRSQYGNIYDAYEQKRDDSSASASTGVTRALKAIPVLYVYCLPGEGYAGTYLKCIGDFRNVVAHEEYTLDFLPFTSISFSRVGLAKFPTGRAQIAEPIVAAINELEDTIDEVLAASGKQTIIYDASRLDPEDVDHQNGKLSPLVKFNVSQLANTSTAPMEYKSLVEVIPAPSLDPLVINRLRMLENKLVESTGISPLDMGTGFTGGSKTATEIAQIAASAGAMRAFIISRVRDAAINLIYKWIVLCRLYDKEPMTISVDDSVVTVNDPSNPATSLAMIFGEDRVTRVEIADESLNADSLALSRQSRIAQLMQLVQFAPQNVDVAEIIKEIVSMMGMDANKITNVQPMQPPMQPPIQPPMQPPIG